MGSRAKEDEKNEKIIRSLLKQNSNRRCINCSSMGPQYVCLNFWTFVCTTCSGIHREFTHRVKSVSMSKFTIQEVSALQSGGNEKARYIHFKEWDPQRQPLPDSSNVERLRDFIKSVYVDKRFSGERLPQGRGGDHDGGYESRRSDPRMDNRVDSRSPPYEDRYEERRIGARHSNGFDDRRHDDRFGRFNEKRSPGRFETDRSRYAKGNNENCRYDERGHREIRDRNYEDRYNEGLDRRFEERFANEIRNTEIVHHRREFSGGSPPIVRSVKEILGDDIPPLRVEDRKFSSNGSKEGEGLQDSCGQRFGSSSSFGSVDGMAPVHKGANLESLIDFSAEPDLSPVSEQPDPFGLTPAIQQTANTSGSTGWATFDTFSTAPLTVSAPEVSGGMNNSFTQMNDAGNWASLQTAAHPAPSVPFPYDLRGDGSYKLGGPSQPSASIVDPNQAWNAFQISTASTPERPTAMQTEATHSQQLLRPTASATGPQVASNPIKQRHEIPEDLFTSLVPERNLQNMGLHMSGAPLFVPQVAAVGSVRLPGQIAAYVQPHKSTNPFDLPDDSPSISIESGFPSLSSLHTTLPSSNVAPMPMHGFGVQASGLQWLQSNVMSPQMTSNLPTGFLVGQQPQNTLSAVETGSMGVGISGHAFSGSGQSLDGQFLGHLNPQLPSQTGVSSNSLFHVQAGSQFSQNTLRPVGASAFGSESLFPVQVGQQHPSQASLGSFGNRTLNSDSVFHAQGVQHMSAQSSLTSVGGNPFG